MVKELAMPAVSVDAVPEYPTTLHLLAHTRPVLISTGMDATTYVANHELCCGTAYTPLLMILSVTPLPVEVPVHTHCSNTSYMSHDIGRLKVAVVSAFAAGAADSISITTLFATTSENRSAVPTFLILNVCTAARGSATAPAYLAENVAEKVWNAPPDATEKSILEGKAWAVLETPL